MNSSKKIIKQQNKSDDNKTVTPVSAKKVRLGSTGEESHLKAIVLSAICVALVIVLCVGVAVQQFKPEVVMKVGDTKFTMNDLLYPIYERESQMLPYDQMYQAYMGSSVWDATYQGDDKNVEEGTNNAEGLKQEVTDKETEYEVLYNEAKKADYKLTEDEEKKAKDQAVKALKGLSWGQKLRLNISKSKLTKRFEKRILADRYKEDQQKTLNKDVDENEAIKDVSQKDYREYDVQYYSVSTTTTDKDGNTKDVPAKKLAEYRKEIEALAKKAATAKDFTKLIEDEDKSDIKYETAEFTEKDGWSMVSADNLKKIKDLKNGEISEVYYDKEASVYIFVKMIDNNSTKSYQKACEDAVKEAQDKKYNEWLTELEKGYKIFIDYDIWNDVTIGTVTTDIVTADDLAKMKEDASSSSSAK